MIRLEDNRQLDRWDLDLEVKAGEARSMNTQRKGPTRYVGEDKEPVLIRRCATVQFYERYLGIHNGLVGGFGGDSSPHLQKGAGLGRRSQVISRS